jgi:hypothetical protein
VTFPLSPPRFFLISPHLGCAEIPPLRTARKGSVLAAKAVETQFAKAVPYLGWAKLRVGSVMSTKAGSRSGGRRSRLLVRRIALPPVGASHFLWANAQERQILARQAQAECLRKCGQDASEPLSVR